ncbi:MAG: putative selenate reductase subunit YgfK [Oscillospiraceae bacterium]|nr:putative selenate reductase subunit YgfK [Oscillospiraceae bacterium]MCL2278116.1 putative selenate reductase subunit YgfK [Oscillospiraceae bacterium]
MSDRMRQISFGALMNWVLTEYSSEGSVFGVFKHFVERGNNRSYEIFGERVSLPFGPAAGPHTQLAQNLIAGYVAGARFFELKTVQLLDGEDLPVSKPCILAEDEGYNVEWSTELYVPQAMDEYIKGWFAIKLLSRELGLGVDDGFIFNMSVGYDLDGIKSEKIDCFIEGLKNAENTKSWKICRDWAVDNVSRFKHVDVEFIDSISAKICNSITLSTLHGCPPDEIERIATYLISEKGLHTFIKCNPTLLGFEFARNTLDGLGFDYISFDDHHFKADLQFEDAVPMLKRLQVLADGQGLEFGVKLTNTFPVKITEGELPGEEMYMSGRSLFPLSIEVANRLSKAFDGKLHISFSGGVDVRNIRDVLVTGIWPITIATTLLKPGGYERLYQIASELSGATEVCSLDASAPAIRFSSVDIARLETLVGKASKVSKGCRESIYEKQLTAKTDRKLEDKAPLLDCFIAPCQNGCPFGQDVPAYLRLMDEGKSLEALKVIAERNPLPHITGTICSHNCMNKCTRDFYEGSVDIRAVKLKAALSAFESLLDEAERSSERISSVAVVGGGPAGLSCAYFLARSGYNVTIFERENTLGGLVSHVIPEFRIGNDAINRDLALIEAYGVKVQLNAEINDLEALKTQGFEHIVLAVGAESALNLKLAQGEVIQAINLLKRLKRTSNVSLGKKVAVVGGGNTAMDVARATLRVPGVSEVLIIYRRKVRDMPADFEELKLALDEGVKVFELLSPLSHENGELICEVMRPGELDSSGRRRSKRTGEIVKIEADSVVSAIGNDVKLSFFEQLGISISDRGKVEVNQDTMESKSKNVYVIGDAQRGPATVAEAISDAAKCASAIAKISFKKYADLNISTEKEAAKGKKGIHYRCNSEISEFGRCLECPSVCQLCVDVCPNRANVNIEVNGSAQIIHIDFMCNECGNCKIFCPYSGAPYTDKFTLFINEEDFHDSDNNGVLFGKNEKYSIRLDGHVILCEDLHELPDEVSELIRVLGEKTEITI